MVLDEPTSALGVHQASMVLKYIVKAADQRSGWNYLRIVHTVGSTNATSNYIEWINGPSPPAMKSFIARIENINLVERSNEFYKITLSYNYEIIS